MKYKYLKINNIEDGIVVMAISSPKTLNALNYAILKEIDSFVSNIDYHLVRLLIITGEGKSFVAGANIAEMYGFSEQEALQFAQFGTSIFTKMENLEIPVIAAVNGYALGGGCELAMACDIRIASTNACFGQPEVRLGIIPGFSGTIRLTQLVGKGIAKEIIFTGRKIKAEEAYRIGLVNMLAEPDKIIETAITKAKEIISNSSYAIKNAKKSINAFDGDINKGYNFENELFSNCFSVKDAHEGMCAFLEKREPQFVSK